MPNIFFFSRNRCTRVEQIDDKTMRSSCLLQDTLTDARVEILVRLPDLEIIGVEGEIRQSKEEVPADYPSALQKVIGVRIGAGMLKIIRGLVGERPGLETLTFMIEECCHGVILIFTKDELAKVPSDPLKAKAHYHNMVKENIRLYNRCAAFAPGSSVVEGIEPPE